MLIHDVSWGGRDWLITSHFILSSKKHVFHEETIHTKWSHVRHLYVRITVIIKVLSYHEQHRWRSLSHVHQYSFICSLRFDDFLILADVVFDSRQMMSFWFCMWSSYHLDLRICRDSSQQLQFQSGFFSSRLPNLFQITKIELELSIPPEHFSVQIVHVLINLLRRVVFFLHVDIS